MLTIVSILLLATALSGLITFLFSLATRQPDSRRWLWLALPSALLGSLLFRLELATPTSLLRSSRSTATPRATAAILRTTHLPWPGSRVIPSSSSPATLAKLSCSKSPLPSSPSNNFPTNESGQAFSGLPVLSLSALSAVSAVQAVNFFDPRLFRLPTPDSLDSMDSLDP